MLTLAVCFTIFAATFAVRVQQQAAVAPACGVCMSVVGQAAELNAAHMSTSEMQDVFYESICPGFSQFEAEVSGSGVVVGALRCDYRRAYVGENLSFGIGAYCSAAFIFCHIILLAMSQAMYALKFPYLMRFQSTSAVVLPMNTCQPSSPRLMPVVACSRCAVR